MQVRDYNQKFLKIIQMIDLKIEKLIYQIILFIY